MTKTDQTHASPRRQPWWFGALAATLPILALLAAEGILRVAGLRPPDHPLLFHVGTFAPDFSPFVEERDGMVTIRPDWIKNDELYRLKQGRRHGRLFLYPGFRPCRFSRRKQSDTIRIFALGGSTTFGQFVPADACFAQRIGAQLEARVGANRRVEVINLGCPGLESTRVLSLMRTVLRFDPDLVLVYTGNNELIMGEETEPGRLGTADAIRARLLAASQLYGWIEYAVSRWRRSAQYEIVAEEKAALESGYMLQHIPTVDKTLQRLPSARFRRNAAATLEANIRDMAHVAAGAGVRVLFFVPAVNLLLEPELSAHAPGFTATAEFDNHIERARKCFTEGDSEQALTEIEKALALSPDHALAHYAHGRILLKLDRPAAARQELQQAVDLNVYTHRATSPLQETMVRVLREIGAAWIDLRPVLWESVDPAAARRLFVDHCHPTAAGHSLIAAKAIPLILDLLRLPSESRGNTLNPDQANGVLQIQRTSR